MKHFLLKILQIISLMAFCLQVVGAPIPAKYRKELVEFAHRAELAMEPLNNQVRQGYEQFKAGQDDEYFHGTSQPFYYQVINASEEVYLQAEWSCKRIPDGTSDKVIAETLEKLKQHQHSDYARRLQEIQEQMIALVSQQLDPLLALLQVYVDAYGTPTDPIAEKWYKSSVKDLRRISVKHSICSLTEWEFAVFLGRQIESYKFFVFGLQKYFSLQE